jgi:hypothetical protein
MEKSQSISKIALALIMLQSKVDKIRKDSSNPFFNSKYASLSTIQDEIQLPLAETGLCYTQHPESNNSLTTILIHAESGEYMQSTFDIHPAKTDPQSLGSAITYGKRYALVAILGLNIDDDDDANHASGNGAAKAATNTTKTGDDAKKWLNPKTPKWDEAIKYLTIDGGSIAKIETNYKLSKENKTKLIEEAQEVMA